MYNLSSSPPVAPINLRYGSASGGEASDQLVLDQLMAKSSQLMVMALDKGTRGTKSGQGVVNFGDMDKAGDRRLQIERYWLTYHSASMSL